LFERCVCEKKFFRPQQKSERIFVQNLLKKSLGKNGVICEGEQAIPPKKTILNLDKVVVSASSAD
jgi:hypothetical protein